MFFKNWHIIPHLKISIYVVDIFIIIVNNKQFTINFFFVNPPTRKSFSEEILPSAIKEGGTIIICSSCKNRIEEKEFEDLLMQTKSADEFLNKINNPKFFVIDQWQVEEICKTLKKAEIMYYSDEIDDNVLRNLLVTPIASMEEGLKRAFSKYGENTKIIAIPEDPYLIPE
ncbi:hypothetical protein J7K55_02385 [Candidatus Aerophobetes bacterium]|nr:hypothetical protein [Candidatus Aerophobetes bacterium]